MRVAGVIVLMVLLVAACVPATAPPAEPSTVTTAAPQPTATLPVKQCTGGDPFLENGPLLAAGAGRGDASRITGLAATEGPGCEELTITLATSAGAPATSTGPVEVQILRDLGVIRILLPDVTETSITDGVFELSLADRVFVVRDATGSLFVDVHLGDAALARASIRESPARVVVELTPGGSPLPPPAARSDLIVVLAPRGAKASYPLVVEGYSRTFEGNVVARLVKGGKVAAEEITTATDYVTTWGQFSLEFDDGPQGRVELTVGDEAGASLSLSLVLN